MVILISLPFLSMLIQSHSSRDTIFFEQTDLYWEPPTSAAELYNQLAKRKYREIQRDQVRYYAWEQQSGSTKLLLYQLFPLSSLPTCCETFLMLQGWNADILSHEVYTHVVLKGDPNMHNKFCTSDSIPMSNMNGRSIVQLFLQYKYSHRGITCLFSCFKVDCILQQST